jgi:hypothetical protein
MKPTFALSGSSSCAEYELIEPQVAQRDLSHNHGANAPRRKKQVPSRPKLLIEQRHTCARQLQH